MNTSTYHHPFFGQGCVNSNYKNVCNDMKTTTILLKYSMSSLNVIHSHLRLTLKLNQCFLQVSIRLKGGVHYHLLDVHIHLLALLGEGQLRKLPEVSPTFEDDLTINL